jgi:uncharacterized membrane protein
VPSDRSGDRRAQYRALAVIAVGLAHFVLPTVFDPINGLAFPERPRRFTYINGAIETLIGVSAAVPQFRKTSTFLSAGYGLHLVGNMIRTQARTHRRADRAARHSR